jgi:protocatechuate 3,4-dioxygenase beta subunit
MKKIILANAFLLLISLFTGCHGQVAETLPSATNKIVGGGCDGCELMYVDMPKVIHSENTSPGWNEKGQKLIVTGTVFQIDGRTPAPNVIIYYWQADNNGLYSPSPGMNEKAKKHGHIRGWMKTDTNGKYTIKTIRPAPYPKQQMAAHIHLSIKEPDIKNEYYTDEINFDDDKLLIRHFKKYPQENRGGSGVMRVLLKDSLQIAEHNIILGLNIPNYPKKPCSGQHSGLNIGEDQPSFTPFHASGPDKGTKTCPVCKYGRYHGIIYFVGNHPNWDDIKKWLTFLEEESVKRRKYLKVYFVYGNDHSYNREERKNHLVNLGKELHIQNTALTFVPSFSDPETEANLNKINPDVENTFIIYKHRNIVDKFINLEPSSENFKLIINSMDRTRGLYFELPEPEYD